MRETSSNRIILNVGGTKVETYRSTLTAHPTTLLGIQFRDTPTFEQVDKNEYFIDRNSRAFHYIIEYYRTGKMFWRTGCCGVTKEEMIEELTYFQLPIDILDNESKIKSKSTNSPIKHASNRIPSRSPSNSPANLSTDPPLTPPHTPKQGKIQLVGAGPGDPELLTRSAYRAIKEADIILSDRLVPAEVLELIPSHIDVMIANKTCGNAEPAQEELYKLAMQALEEGKNVVRLKQGDPYLFGRGGEEYRFFQSKGYDPIVIPGVSSCMAAPLLAKIPTTFRGISSQFLVCTGTGRRNTLPDIPKFHPNRTSVFLMAIHRMRQLSQDLIDIGEYPPDTPCAMVERASCKDQRVIKGTVGNIAEVMERVGCSPPGTLVVGKVCDVLYEDGRRYDGVVYAEDVLQKNEDRDFEVSL
ncbi:10670_t:CDS:2 [Paraglomus occultum]|uniref:uroporphyrinogen-III C-methyltransferase n=1 Tax=Paraglomus occultum TaxID=144539 RepID=A0A9N9CBT7_9GLOM|nr:10670_t:CDS:2 [Paraglomus occultum]